MGKRLSKYCLMLLVFFLSFTFMEVVLAAAEDEGEEDRGLAYIAGVSCIESDYDFDGVKVQYTVKEIRPEYKDLEEYIKFWHEKTKRYGGDYQYYGGLYSSNGQSDTARVTVAAKTGATVSYSKGSKMKVAYEPDYSNTDSGYDFYYFHVPYKTVKNGGTFKVTAELKGEKKELKVVFAKPEKKNAKWSKKVKASIVASEDYDYGEIILTIDNKEVKRFPIEHEDIRDGATMRIDMDRRIGTGSSIYIDEQHPDDQEYLEFIDIPWAGFEWIIHNEYYVASNGKFQEFYVALDGTPTDTEWKIKSLIWDINIKFPYNGVKVKIPAQKAAPKIKVDMVKEKIGISPKMQYYIKLPVIGEDGSVDYDYSNWADGKQGMTLSDLGDITSGAEIWVRTKGANGKIPSAKRHINIPERQAIDLSKVSAEGPATQCALKISDLDKAKNPYEYTCAEPTKNTKWKTLKSSSVNLKKNEVNETTPVIYVRQKALNENTKNKIEMRQASNIAVLTYDSTENKWTASAWDMSKLK